MRLKIFLLALVTAATAASVAVAAPQHDPPGRGKAEAAHAKKACKHVILKGLFKSAASDSKSFELDVKRANRHGRALSGLQTVQVDEKTKYRRKTEGKPASKSALGDFKEGDRLNVQARACKASGESAGAAAPAADASITLLARRVVGHAPKTEAETETETPSGTTSP
jgi:hypothetical protein